MKNSSAWSMFLLSNPCKCMSPILDLIKLIAFCKIRLSLPRITLHSLFEMVIPLNFLETKTVLLGDHVLNKLFWEGHKNWAHPPHFFWHYSVTSNCKWTMGRIFVAFSEYLNFTYMLLQHSCTLWTPVPRGRGHISKSYLWHMGLRSLNHFYTWLLLSRVF